MLATFFKSNFSGDKNDTAGMVHWVRQRVLQMVRFTAEVQQRVEKKNITNKKGATGNPRTPIFTGRIFLTEILFHMASATAIDSALQKLGKEHPSVHQKTECEMSSCFLYVTVLSLEWSHFRKHGGLWKEVRVRTGRLGFCSGTRPMWCGFGHAGS